MYDDGFFGRLNGQREKEGDIEKETQRYHDLWHLQETFVNWFDCVCGVEL